MKVLILCWIFLCSVSQGEARGGGRTSGGSYSVPDSSGSSGSPSSSGSSGSSYDSGNYYSGSSYNSEPYGYHNHGYSYGRGTVANQQISTWIIIIFVVMILFVACACIHVKCRGLATNTGARVIRVSYEGTTPCYMCLSRIRNSDWDSEHRKHCFYGNKEEILGYPTPHKIFCPKCGEILRLWPKKGDPFICDNSDRGECAFQAKYPAQGSEIRNTGTNRFNCFICDYDLCEECVLLEASGPPTFKRIDSIKYNKYNFDPNKATSPVNPNTNSQRTSSINHVSPPASPAPTYLESTSPSSPDHIVVNMDSPAPPAATPDRTVVNRDPSSPPSYFDAVKQDK